MNNILTSASGLDCERLNPVKQCRETTIKEQRVIKNIEVQQSIIATASVNAIPFEKAFYRGMNPGRNDLLILNRLIKKVFECAHSLLCL